MQVAKLRWILYAVLLFALYWAVLPADTPRIPDGILPISQAHRIVAEDLQLTHERIDTALLGSSLSEVMPKIALRPIRSLALTGGSATTGAQLLRAFDHAPKVVLIEANVLGRPADRDLLSDVLSPARMWVVEHCRACRSRNRPLTVALTVVSHLRTKPMSDIEEDALYLGSPRGGPPAPELLAVQMEASTRPPDAAALKQSLDELAPVVDWLEQKGTRVVFVDMPMHRAAVYGPYNQATLAAVAARFPESRYTWFRFRDREYDTSDGHHMTYPEARIVAQELARRVASLPPRQ